MEIANLELFLGQMLGGVLMMGGNSGQIIYLSSRSAFGRIAILENAVELALVPGPHRKVIEKLVSRAKAILQKRHDLIHGMWLQRKATGEVLTAKLPYVAGTEVPISEQYLTDMIRDIRNLIDEIKAQTTLLFEAADRLESRVKRATPTPPAADKTL